jgi:sulfonate transport system permease protein
VDQIATLNDGLSRASQSAPPAIARRRGRRLVPRRLPPGGILLGPLVLVVVWQIASMAGWLSPRTLAAPSTAVATAFEMLQSGVLEDHLLASAERAYLGLAIGVATGVALALVAGLSRFGEAAVDGLVQIKRAIPTLALIPLGILWLGIGDTMKVALIATSVFIPVYINTDRSVSGGSNSCAASPSPALCRASSPDCGWRSPPAGRLWSCWSRSTPPTASAT